MSDHVNGSDLVSLLPAGGWARHGERVRPIAEMWATEEGEGGFLYMVQAFQETTGVKLSV